MRLAGWSFLVNPLVRDCAGTQVCNLLSICVWLSKEEVSGLTPSQFIGVWLISAVAV